MTAFEIYLIFTNVILFGIAVITYLGAKRFYIEIQHRKHFMHTFATFMEDYTGKSEREIEQAFDKFMDERVKDV